MNAKEIRKALKAGKSVIFNRHIYGAPHGYERFPVVSARDVAGLLQVRFVYDISRKPAWGLVQPDLDDYVSLDPAFSR